MEKYFNQKITDIKEFTLDEAKEFIEIACECIGWGFNPEEPAEGYINCKTRKDTFTPEECKVYDHCLDLMWKAFEKANQCPFDFSLMQFVTQDKRVYQYFKSNGFRYSEQNTMDKYIGTSNFDHVVELCTHVEVNNDEYHIQVFTMDEYELYIDVHVRSNVSKVNFEQFEKDVDFVTNRVKNYILQEDELNNRFNIQKRRYK